MHWPSNTPGGGCIAQGGGGGIPWGIYNTGIYRQQGSRRHWVSANTAHSNVTIFTSCCMPQQMFPEQANDLDAVQCYNAMLQALTSRRRTTQGPQQCQPTGAAHYFVTWGMRTTRCCNSTNCWHLLHSVVAQCLIGGLQMDQLHKCIMPCWQLTAGK